MKLTDFSGGLNTLQPADNIQDNQFTSLTNVCYEGGSILQSRFGMSLHRTVANVRKVYPFYVGGTLHMIYTTTAGLYDNATLLDATFTGTFIADEWASMLYLTNGTYFKRYDGTTLYDVGVAAPDPPTVVASSYDKIVIDDFETNPVNWAIAAAPYNGGTNGAVARETGAGNFMEQSTSIKLTCSEGSDLRIDKTTFGTDQDWSQFSGGDSSDSDYLSVWVKINNPEYMDGFQILVDINGGTWTDYFYSPPKLKPGVGYESRTARWTGRYITKKVGFINITLPEWVTDSTFSEVYLPSAADEFVLFKIPKGDMERSGVTANKGWDTVRKVSVIVWGNQNTGGNDLEVYLDDAAILGAEGVNSGLSGGWYFCSGYYNSTRDEYYEVSQEAGPVILATNNVTYSAVPATFPDAQADRYIIWARQESMDVWFQLVSVEEGTTTDDVNHDLDSLVLQPELTEQAGIFPLPKQLASGKIITRATSNNSVPPVGDYIIMHRGKLFILSDDKIYHSKPGQPWAIPTNFFLRSGSTSDNFQAAYSDGATLIVHTRGKDYVYVNPGEYDAGFLYMGYLAEGRNVVGCVAPHSADHGIFCSTQGISTFDGQVSHTFSDRIRPTYRAISDKTALHACVYESSYILVDPGGDIMVMEKMGESLRFFQWSTISTARCCVVDGRTGRLYIGTDTGIYYYNTSTQRDSEGNFTVTAHSKKFEYGGVDRDMPLERWGVEANTGGNDVAVSFLVDGVSHGSGTVNSTVQSESEGFMDLGAVGSKVQLRIVGTVSENSLIKVYAVEVT